MEETGIKKKVGFVFVICTSLHALRLNHGGRTVQHMLALVSALLDVTLESARVERLEKLKATE
jgi:hypothetical protein